MQRLIFILALSTALCATGSTIAQDFLPTENVDSAFVSETNYDWTIRLVAVQKSEILSIRNDDAKIKYRPVDPFSIGVGFSYKTWVADIGIRLNTNTAHESRRFDFRTSVLLGPHLLDLGFLYYKGFEEATDNFISPFRDDIRTTTISVDYLYFPNAAKTSYRGSQTGLQFQRKSFGSPLVGGFIERHEVRGDSSLVPVGAESQFSENNMFNRFNNRSAGMLFGYAQFQRITDNVFGALMFTSGIGGFWGRQWFDTGNKDHVAGAIIQLNGYAAIGYNWRRVYTIANYSIDARFIGFGSKRSYNYHFGRFKVAFGYKLWKK